MSSSGMREKYQSLALTDLKEIAKSRGIKGTSSMKKADVIEAMLALDEQESRPDAGETETVEEKKAAETKPGIEPINYEEDKAAAEAEKKTEEEDDPFADIFKIFNRER